MFISDQMFQKLKCDIDEYLYLPCIGTKHTKANGKRVAETTVYMEFRVCFTFAKYENETLSLCETTNVFIDAYLLFRNPFSSVRAV